VAGAGVEERSPAVAPPDDELVELIPFARRRAAAQRRRSFPAMDAFVAVLSRRSPRRRRARLSRLPAMIPADSATTT
jgi:hypothetical protein